MTEKLLYQAFDFQRFVCNARLQKVIDASHARTASRELSDEELDLVSAAGIQEMQEIPDKTGTSEILGIPRMSEKTGLTGMQNIPGNPGKTGMPGMRKMPEISGKPKMPGNNGMAGRSGISGKPEDSCK